MNKQHTVMAAIDLRHGAYVNYDDQISKNSKEDDKSVSPRNEENNAKSNSKEIRR